MVQTRSSEVRATGRGCRGLGGRGGGLLARGRDQLDERGEGPRPGRRLLGRGLPHVRPRPRGCAGGLHDLRAQVAVGAVEQRGQDGARQVVGRAHQVQVRAQERRRRVREQRGAQRRRARDVAGVEGERDQELLRAVAAQHGEVAPVAAEPRLLRAQERAHGRGALRATTARRRTAPRRPARRRAGGSPWPRAPRCAPPAARPSRPPRGSSGSWCRGCRWRRTAAAASWRGTRGCRAGRPAASRR